MVLSTKSIANCKGVGWSVMACTIRKSGESSILYYDMILICNFRRVPAMSNLSLDLLINCFSTIHDSSTIWALIDFIH